MSKQIYVGKEHIKPNRCRCGGKSIVKQDRKTAKYFVICQECLTRTEKFESSATAVEVWNMSAGKRFEPKTGTAPWNPAVKRYVCEKCGGYVGKYDKYCHECGLKLTDWTEEGRSTGQTVYRKKVTA